MRREVVWRLPTSSRIRQMLTNPTYAGAGLRAHGDQDRRRTRARDTRGADEDLATSGRC